MLAFCAGSASLAPFALTVQAMRWRDDTDLQDPSLPAPRGVEFFLTAPITPCEPGTGRMR